MAHFASIRHPAAILDDLHGKVLNEAYQISKSTVTESVSVQNCKRRGFFSLLFFIFFCTIRTELNNHLPQPDSSFQQRETKPFCSCDASHSVAGAFPHRSEYESVQSQTGKQEPKLSKTEGTTPAPQNMSQGQTDLSVKPDNVKIKGLQANVSIPKVRAVTSPNNERPPACACWSRCCARIRSAQTGNRRVKSDFLPRCVYPTTLVVFQFPASYVFVLWGLIQRGVR